MTRSGRAALLGAWTCLVAAVVMDVAGTVQSQGHPGWWTVGPLVWAMTVSSAVAGVVVLRTSASHPVGWLLAAQAPVVAAVLWADSYVDAGLAHGFLPGLGWVAVWSATAWPLLFFQLASIGYLFPTGRPLSRRWGWFQGIASLAYPVFILASALDGERFPAQYRAIAAPLPGLPWLKPVAVAAMPLLLAHLFGSAACARARFRRASGVLRLQLLWFAWAALLIPGGLVVCLLDQVLHGTEGSLTVVAIAIGGTVVPAAIGVAMVRHQLFDIELVLSRSLLYAGLIGTVTGVYAAAVYGLGALLSSRGVAGFLAVAVVAIGIEPVRTRLRRGADHFVYGDRSDPYQALSRLSDRLQASLAPDEVLPTVVAAVRDALRWDYVGIELQSPHGLAVAASAGCPARGEGRRVPLTYQRTAFGELVVQAPAGVSITAADERLLADLARSAGIAVHAVGLSEDLQRSRQRLVTAREEERRRLRRDLHDGLGPELASIVMRLEGARVRTTDEELAAVLGEVARQTGAAVQEIRRLVDDLRPPALDEVGLVAALRQQADRLSEAAVLIDVHGPNSPSLPAAVEVAAYRIVMEAMTNVVKHASARRCVVEVELNGHLALAVSDNGCGLPAQRGEGVGMASMRERASELGGTCTVERRPEGGTEVRAVLPVQQ